MNKDNKPEFLFHRENYILLISGIAAIFLGFLLMAGGGSDSLDVYNPEVFSFRRITLAPVVMLAGMAAVLVAIMRKPKED